MTLPIFSWTGLRVSLACSISVDIIPYPDQRLEAHYAPSIVGYVLLYISIPPDRRQKVSESCTIPYLHCPLIPYSPSTSVSDSFFPISSLPSAYTCPALIPMISRACCCHHCLYRRIPRFYSAAKQNPTIGWVKIYYVTVFWLREIYTLISSSPTTSITVPMGGYTQILSVWHLGTIPTIRRAARWWNPLRGLSNWGVRTHVWDPNRSTACTTTTYNLPAVLLSAPSLPKIFFSRIHFPCALHRFCSTTSQFSSVDDNIHSRYRNEETAASGVPYDKKSRPIWSSFSSTNNLLRLIYVPLQHIAEVGCSLLRAFCGTDMSQWGHWGWVWFPSSRMNIISW